MCGFVVSRFEFYNGIFAYKIKLFNIGPNLTECLHIHADLPLFQTEQVGRSDFYSGSIRFKSRSGHLMS